jgi:hypothetical protein
MNSHRKFRQVPDFSFNEGNHTYHSGGVNIPSCTRVLDHAGLVSYDMVREDVLARKSKIGTLVHLATAYYDREELDWASFTDSEIDQENKRRVEAWAQFREDTRFAPFLIEQRSMASVNGMRFGMTVDRVGIMNGRECVVEIKTTAQVHPWYAIQTAGYALGAPHTYASQRAAFINRRRVVVLLGPDGRYKKTDFNDKTDADVFTSALHVSWWKLQHGMNLRPLEVET